MTDTTKVPRELDQKESMLSWQDETNATPAPVFLAGLCGLLVYLALQTKFHWLWMFAVVFGLFAIQITIWRAVRAALAALESSKEK